MNTKLHSPSSLPTSQRYSIYMAVVEGGVGAALQGARIPCVGYILSLLQAFFLTKATRHTDEIFTPMYISTTSAILKTLSPSGRKLTPMLAIVVQGGLFNVGVLIFGKNILGHILGAILLSLWGFIQPSLLAYIIFGQDLWAGLQALEQFIHLYAPHFSLLAALAGIVFFKAILAALAVGLAYSGIPVDTLFHQYVSKSLPHLTNHHSTQKKPMTVSLVKDLTRPWFMISFVAVGIFAWWRGDFFFSMTVYLAYSILIFMALRVVNTQKLFIYIEKVGLPKLSLSLRTILSMMGKEQEEAYEHSNL